MLTLAGGILGVLMMVPLRRALIVKEHGIAALPGRHGLRRGARRRRARRQAGGARVRRPRRRRAVEGAVVGLQPLPHRGRLHAAARPASSRTPRSTSTSRRSTSASATSSARGSPGTMFAGGVLSWLVLLPLLSILGAVHHRAVPADPSELRDQPGDRPAVPDFGDGARAVLERLHPLHRRGRRARRRAHHAGADAFRRSSRRRPKG